VNPISPVAADLDASGRRRPLARPLPFKECASAAFDKLSFKIKLVVMVHRIKWMRIHAFYQGTSLKQ
jgi:hypothetical protein